ncbi:helix-turn-helix transcriptional regulator [Riemerella anatipestifer]|nr:helix-turn-helix transcriptional regulator [Riemerella anatipestifer]
MSKINENIKYIRESNKLSQSEFGQIIEKGASLVSAYEKGISVPPLNIILKIAEKFNYSIDELVYYNLNEIDKGRMIKKNNNNVDEINETLGYSIIRESEILDNLNFSKINSEIIQLWEWIENSYINIINLKILINETNNISVFDEYSFLSDIRNKYLDEKVLFYTGKKPYIEKEYKGELNDIKNIKYENLLKYKEELFNNYNTFLEVLNSILNQLMKKHYGNKK